MSIHKVNEIFIGAGSALSANNTALNAIAVQTGIVGQDMTTLNPAGGDTISTQPSIFLVNKLANGEFKRSFPIKGTSVTGYKGEHYDPSRRCVWSVGYKRANLSLATADGAAGSRAFTAAGGSIEVNNSTVYTMSVLFKNDKIWFSERPERLSIQFTSSAAATQSNIADQIVNAINNSPYGSQPSGIKCIKAVKVGDGTGAMGLTGASNYGVEMWGLSINQFLNTQYGEELVNFSVAVDDASGFETTACSQISALKYGTGTYTEVYNMENKFYGNEGVLNRRAWPVPTLAYLSSSTLTSSANVAAAATLPTGNVSAVAVGDDVLTVATATTGLRPGEIIDVNGVEYEILYLMSATTFRIVDTATAIYAGGAALKVKYGYNIINISVTDTTFQDGAGVGQFSSKGIYIATPAIDAAAADPFDRTLDSADTSAECLDLLDILDAWMATTPLAPAAITLA